MTFYFIQKQTHQIAVTKKELRKWYKDFIMDYPTGELKMEEFQNIYKQFFPNGDPTKFAKFVFDVFDSNKVRFITDYYCIDTILINYFYY